MTEILVPLPVGQALLQGAAALTDASDSPQLDSQLLLGQVIGQSRSWLLTHSLDLLNESQVQGYEALLHRRAQGEPVAYLLGTQGFWDMDLAVTAATLIPRPETELLVEVLLTLPEAPAFCLMDLGTGTGAIAIAIQRERRHWNVCATDKSAAALAVAQNNANACGTPGIAFIEADWLKPVRTQSLDIIVANPPYIEPDDVHLRHLSYEPQQALVAADAGFADLYAILQQATRCLRPGGHLLLEHGYHQQVKLEQRLRALKFTNIQCYADLNQQPRAIMASWPGSKQDHLS